MKHADTFLSAPRRARTGRVLARALAGGGLVAAGAAFGVLLALPGASDARAGEANYVRSASHDAVSNVRLDEEVSILFKARIYPRSVGPDTILLRTGPTLGIGARGQYFVGRFLYDRSVQRRAVIRPEAVREYFQLIGGFSREDATRRSARTIQQIEATGRLRLLAKIDRALVKFFGTSFGAGTRLDDKFVFANYPPPLNSGDPIQPYRDRVAGDDAKWQDYSTNQNFNAYVELQQNPEYERFYHRVDPATGIADSSSVLRSRQYRRVLIDKRAGNRVTFAPEVPIRADLTDTGYQPGSPYTIIVPAHQDGVYNTVLTQRGLRPLLQADGRDFSTYFTTLVGSVASSGLFLDNESRSGLTDLQAPRVINTTPPNGETYVDPTTDWEDPESSAVPPAARKTFTIRIRFAQPIDPRTVSPTTFTLRKIKNNPNQSNEQAVDIPVAAGTFLSQRRLGIVEVEVTPATNLDGNGQYELTVRGLVKSLGGVLLNTDYKISFITGNSPPPLDAIREDFRNAQNKASPFDPATDDQFSTAHWPAPATLDAGGTGLSVAKFMPFVGGGLGTAILGGGPITALDVQPGQTVLFPTEDFDPGSSTFGQQLEFEFTRFTMAAASASTIGRFALVIRSQTLIDLNASTINVRGGDGGVGRMNVDKVNGDPPGGIGGAAGPGGHRGGDGGASAVTDEVGEPILDGQGKIQFDQAKFDGQDGYPGYTVDGLPGGGGSGGFSGDREFVITTDWNGDTVIGDPGDYQLEPGRYREPGGGGGHATDGGNGDSFGLSGQLKSGVKGGAGGGTYGDGAFSTSPLNANGCPTLTTGFGGAGGGGGGQEDDAPMNVADASDAGGGGGGGGGGAIQLVARQSITVNGSVINASGGAGGRTFNENQSDTGQGAAGGCGAGGGILLQAYEGDVTITNGSLVTAGGGSNVNSIGEITTSRNDTPANPVPIKGLGGVGGDGYVRLEDFDGIFNNLGNQVVGSLSTAVFAPQADGSYPGRTDGAPMVINQSVIYSRWFNSRLDTPSYTAQFDDPLTPEIEGIKLDAGTAGGTILIEARSAPNDVANTGNPLVSQATNWVPVDPDPLVDKLSTIGDRRFIQFRVTFTLPLNFDLNPDDLPEIDYLQINIELN